VFREGTAGLRHKQLALGGLFIENRLMVKEGRTKYYGVPTYQLNYDKFEQFTDELEGLVRLWRLADKAIGEAILTSTNQDQIKTYNDGEDPWRRFCKAYAQFWQRYPKANPEVGDLILDHGGKYFVNAKYFPRSGKELALFGRFGKILSCLNGQDKLETRGQGAGSRTMTGVNQGRYEQLKHKGLPDWKIAEKLWPKDYETESDPIPKHKMRLSRHRSALKKTP
jgi:hypothetical protein